MLQLVQSRAEHATAVFVGLAVPPAGVSLAGRDKLKFGVVRDPRGEPVANLTKADFKLFDNSKEQPLAGFSVEENVRTRGGGSHRTGHRDGSGERHSRGRASKGSWFYSHGEGGLDVTLVEGQVRQEK